MFEEQIPEEAMRIIPTRPRAPFYSSISAEEPRETVHEAKDMGTDNISENVREKSQIIQVPLIEDESRSNSGAPPSHSPPVILKPGPNAVEAYSRYINSTAKNAVGPEIVDVQLNEIKSKSVRPAPELEIEPKNEEDMDAFDKDYSEKYRKFLETNNLASRSRSNTVERAGSSEKRVQFNSMKEVVSFSFDE